LCHSQEVDEVALGPTSYDLHNNKAVEMASKRFPALAMATRVHLQNACTNAQHIHAWPDV
jgi:hypothetical protein